MSDIGTSWSRRRAAVAAEAEAEVSAAQDAAARETQSVLADKSDGEILEELGLPDPDCLGLGDDFKGFMSKAVPEHIRKRALRQLWRSDPVLACVDGLNDYDDDFLTGSVGQGAINTGYQVGSGMLAHLLEIERKNVDTAVPAPGLEVEAAAVEPEVATADDTAVDDAEVSLNDYQTQAADTDHAAAPRRMQFHFGDGTA